MTEPDTPEAIRCYTCGAEPKELCRTPSGKKASEPHRNRRLAYYRRHRDDPIAGDSPIAGLARAEAAARDQLDHRTP